MREVNTAPTLATITNRPINEGQLLTITTSASDFDLPVQELTFALGRKPAGATIRADTGVFSWAPSALQLGSNYIVDVIVSDNGSPSMSATQTFITTVVTQTNDCTFAISNFVAVFPTKGGSNRVSILSSSNCTWMVLNTNSWITIRSGSNGFGNGTVNYSVAKNTKRKTRTGTVLIAGHPHLIIQSDSARPKVKIVLPTSKTKTFTNAIVMLVGTAVDNVGVARVEYSLNSKTNYRTTNGTTNWTTLITLNPGKNTLRVRSIDLAGKPSAIVTRTYRYVPTISAPKTAEIANVARDATGGINFQFKVMPGHTYVLQESPDLLHWSSTRTNLATSETLNFSDLFDRSFPQRFFRVVEKP